ncbi:MAG: ATP cone domain-containing protein [Candidatus Saccharimonadales bacterium]
MHCPFCGHKRTEVYNSRNTSQSRRIWRRRRCRRCQRAFTTYEASDLSWLTISKQAGHSEPYIRSKLLVSLHHACQGLDNHIEMIDALTNTVEDQLIGLQQETISAREVADTTLTILKRFHTSAYLRYLSYRGDLASSAHLKETVTNLQ